MVIPIITAIPVGLYHVWFTHKTRAWIHFSIFSRFTVWIESFMMFKQKKNCPGRTHTGCYIGFWVSSRLVFTRECPHIHPSIHCSRTFTASDVLGLSVHISDNFSTKYSNLTIISFFKGNNSQAYNILTAVNRSAGFIHSIDCCRSTALNVVLSAAPCLESNSGHNFAVSQCQTA